MEPGFNFYGNIELLANSEQLLFNGSIIPSEIEGFNISNAIPFNEYFVPGDELTLTISDMMGFTTLQFQKFLMVYSLIFSIIQYLIKTESFSTRKVYCHTILLLKSI